MTCPVCNASLELKRRDAIYCSRTCKDIAKHKREPIEIVRERNNEYYKQNKDKIIEQRRIYFQQNKALFAANCAKRYASKTKSTPKWLTEWDVFYIQELYDIANLRGLHVDHILPLRGKLVCGLHVPMNLQLLTPEANRKKSNTYDPDETSKRERKKKA